MVDARCRLVLAFTLALGLCACKEETASVGDLRCEGKSIECDLKSKYGDSDFTLRNNARPHETVDAGAPDVLPEGEAEVVWTTELSCASEMCFGRPQLVVEEDGSLAFASEVVEPVGLAPDIDGHSTTVRGIWVARYGADGVLLAESEDLVLRGLDPNAPGPSPAIVPTLAATSWGTLLATYTEPERMLRKVGDDAETTVLWDFDDVSVDAMTTEGDELVMAATFASQSQGPTTLYPEVARYDRDGELVWRQTALQGPDVKRISAISNVAIAMREDGQVFAVAADYGFTNAASYRRRLIALAPDGNLRWTGPLFNDPAGQDAYLALTSHGVAVVAHSEYVLDVYDVVGDPPERIELRSVSRFREEYWGAVVLGFVIDADDRLLVMSLEGDMGTPRFFIDRYSADLSERQTFVFPDSEIFSHPAELRQPLASSLVHGMRLGREGELYVWTSQRIFRVELP